RGGPLRQRAVLTSLRRSAPVRNRPSDRLGAVLRRRTTVLATALAVLAAPVLGACSGSTDDDVRTAAQGFLADWAKGSVAAAAKRTTDAAAATSLLQQTEQDLPGAKLSSALGKV